MSRVCLLDFDGVVLRNHKAHRLVSERCIKLTQKCLNIKDPLHARAVNYNLYSTTGHTALGLRKLGIDISRSEFDNYVYKDIDYGELFGDIQNTHLADIKSVKNLKQYCRDNDIHLYIYSNSPTIWCQNILYRMSPSLTDIDCIYTDYYKPDLRSFDSLSENFGAYKYYFIDDSFINFGHVLCNDNWVKIHFTDVSLNLRDDLYFRDDLSRLCEILGASKTFYPV